MDNYFSDKSHTYKPLYIKQYGLIVLTASDLTVCYFL